MRDPLRFPDLNHAVKRDPRTNLRSAQNNWDFWSLLPEAIYQTPLVAPVDTNSLVNTIVQ